MKILSWNVNGLRAAWVHGLAGLINNYGADIYALQETKLDAPFKAAETNRYYAYWSFAENRKGYSGTLCLSKYKPLAVSYDMNDSDTDFDYEGRLITLEFDNFYFVNCYVPNSQSSRQRYDYRCRWDEKFIRYAASLLAKKPTIICGDFNVAVTDRDIYPENLWRIRNSSGYMSTERENMRAVLDMGFVDSYRYIHPDKTGVYSWWSNRLHKRRENRGWRLDYALVSADIAGKIQASTMMIHVMGSDHCPVILDMDIDMSCLNRRPLLLSDIKQVIKIPHSKRSDVVDELTYSELAHLWNSTNWEKAERNLENMQRGLSRTARSRNKTLILKRQKQIASSFDAKILAVRHVCSMSGGHGIDNVTWDDSRDKMAAAMSLSTEDYYAMPSRLLVIRSQDGKERRINLGTYYDKAMQAISAFVLDPVAEAWADPRSFAFRKGRSSFDANECVRELFSGADAPKWAFIADVRQCYESISHDWILDNIPLEPSILEEFLKAGYVCSGSLFPTDAGIGLGCTPSPIIANMTLDGLQDAIYDSLFPDRNTDHRNGTLVRYADDMIISARTKADAEKIKHSVRDFLFERGLELSRKKSRIVKVSDGFTFLSRHYVKKGNNMLITPADSSVERFTGLLKETVNNHVGSQQSLITKLNRKISGWASYHRTEDAGDAFRHIDVCLAAFLIEHCKKMHPKWETEKILAKYWYQRHDGQFCYALPDKKEVHVKCLSDVPLIRHKRVEPDANPYIDLDYFEHRNNEKAIRNITGLYRSVWNRQNGCCHYCGKPILCDQEKTVVEINPGARKKAGRCAYVHMRCADGLFHDVKTDDLPDCAADVSEILEHIDGKNYKYGRKFLPLFDFFNTCTEPKIRLTFDEIEAVLGRSMGRKKTQKTFWSETGFLNISRSWLTHGYILSELDTKKGFAVFQQIKKEAACLDIPKSILSGHIPNEAKYELENYFAYIVKKYGL